MFYMTSEFPFTNKLEKNWILIKQELDQLQEKHFIDWKEKFLYNQGWQVFGLYAFQEKMVDNCRLCPATTRLIEAIPGMTTAGFSRLAPGTSVVPHIGYSQAVLRCHLGLIVPENCGIRVGKQTRTWGEGKCLVFDDTVEHEAWNHSENYRTVLLIDFKKSEQIRRLLAYCLS